VTSRADRPGSLARAAALAAALVVCFGLQIVALGLDLPLQRLYLWPRQLDGLPGVLTAHLLHADVGHLTANILGLIVAGWAAGWATPRLVTGAIAWSAIAAGCFAWLVAPSGIPHVGASGVVFGLLGFLIAAGLVRGEWRSLLTAVLVVVLYGGAWVLLLPDGSEEGRRISWQMHLGGFLGGIAWAWTTRRERAG
jgi:membrane associated rhomboid family serine protease